MLCMTTYLIMMLMIFLSFMLIITKHPMSMGSVLLFQTVLMTMNSGFFHQSFWYSYIIFLVMVGGMLILFIYMTSVASNEKFKFSLKSILLIPMSMLLIFMTKEIFSYSFFWNKSEMLNSINQNNQMMSMSKFFNEPFMLIMIMMMIYLLITLIAVVKITNINYGALRQKF
uniref:NADH-ubiquinone oxidoreductase chain 6 n=1 Tax=Dermestes coarctatus TaxID=2571046 RepID=A0A5C0XMF4_9COLE|nr:NADH dehydrogenase subunit 6 [Dermestes coarctatus]QEK77751.1 NADH dehydrogenase subunit 6 [Dermestes coarctatus]